MQTSDVPASTPPTTNSNAKPNSNATGASDFNTFLTLLTAQMRNQDPLKPMESTEFVAQLASFSSVEQQIETNSKLTELLGAFSDRSSANLTGWLGNEVRRDGSVNFSGQRIEIDVPSNSEADVARLIVRSGSGETVYTRQIDPSAQTISWDGETLGSDIAPTGRYSFEVENYSDDALLTVESGSVFDLVTEVRLDRGETVLVFGDGEVLDARNATAVRRLQQL